MRHQVVMRDAGAAVHDHQRRTLPDSLVVDQHAFGVNITFMNGIDIESGRCRGWWFRLRGLGKAYKREQSSYDNKSCPFHGGNYSCRCQYDRIANRHMLIMIEN